MPAYIGGPDWPALDTALARRDFGAALALAQDDTGVDVAERQLVTGICRAMFHQPEAADVALQESMRLFRSDRPRRAAVAAVFLGRMHWFVHDNPRVANGWFARARTLVVDEPESLEHAIVSLPLPGCDMADTGRLHEDAGRALDTARRLGESALEAKALADLGTALVSLGRVDDGMTTLDEAMAMVLAGEVRSPFASMEVLCNLLSACARVGDLARADEWTRCVDGYLDLGPDSGPLFMYVHCRANLGLVLCDAGRWAQSEATLRLAADRGPRAGPRTDGLVRAALGTLWVAQGRLADVERLLAGRREHPDCALPWAALKLAQGSYADSVDTARAAIRSMGADRMRVARLLRVCVEAELGRGDTAAASAAAAQLEHLATAAEVPVLRALAALAAGRVAEAAGDGESAVTAYTEGLQVLGPHSWPLLHADLRLGLARALVATGQPGAVSEAQAAHIAYEQLGAPAAASSADLLNSLGVAARTRPAVPDATTALTRREREVLALLRDGLSNAEIAARNHNSVRTIEHHVSALLAKLGLRSRAEAAAYAARLEVESRGTVDGCAPDMPRR
jgi:DNA-binding CsgD family transcriptional regulator